MLGMETVAKRMSDYFVGHHPTMPQAAARRRRPSVPPAASKTVRMPP
jgi:hypothetical protein